MQFTITILLPEGQTEADVQAVVDSLAVAEGSQVSVFGTEAQSYVADADGALRAPEPPT